jgi:RHS repeat-associated protein
VTGLRSRALGSTIADSSGAVSAQYSYNAYGIPTNTSNDAYMFTGRRYDFENSTYHYRNRAYNPSLGRFMQPDPIGTDGGINLYEYAAGDPINKTDPMGTCLEDACVGEAALLIAAANGAIALAPEEGPALAERMQAFGESAQALGEAAYTRLMPYAYQATNFVNTNRWGSAAYGLGNQLIGGEETPEVYGPKSAEVYVQYGAMAGKIFNATRDYLESHEELESEARLHEQSVQAEISGLAPGISYNPLQPISEVSVNTPATSAGQANVGAVGGGSGNWSAFGLNSSSLK